MRADNTQPGSYLPDLPALAIDLPVLFEDEGQEHMGESFAHTHAVQALQLGLSTHFAEQHDFRVLVGLELHYHPVNRKAYVTPDVMVVQPTQSIDDHAYAYRIGEDGPPPLLVVEVLSRRSIQQHDLTIKPMLYAQLGIRELLFVDPTGHYLPDRLQLKRLIPGDETWVDVEEGSHPGLASVLGFTVMIEPDHKVRVSHTTTAQVYPRIEETQDVLASWRSAMESLAQMKQGRKVAEDRVRQLEIRIRQLEERLNEERPKLQAQA